MNMSGAMSMAQEFGIIRLVALSAALFTDPLKLPPAQDLLNLSTKFKLGGMEERRGGSGN